jgi:GT2 family glycosyltransferase
MCLDAILENTPPVSSIIVVDDGSSDETSMFLDLEYPKHITTIIRHMSNKGVAPSMNDGIALSMREKYVVVFNNDVMVGRHWLEPLIEFMEANETIPFRGMPAKIGMVSPRVVGPLQNVAKGIYVHYPYRESYSGWLFKYANLEIPAKIEIIPFDKGGPWLFRTSMFAETGMFDEQFVPANWEETDLFVRMALNGWIYCSLNSSYSYHFCHGTINKYFEKEGGVRGLFEINRQRFVDKWGSDNIDLIQTFLARSVQWGMTTKETI